MYEAVVIGCGVVGDRFATAFDAHDDVELVGVCDTDADRAIEFATEYNCAAYADHEDLYEEEFDLVHVGTPPATHREIVTDMLQGRHVICEKPLAPDADEGAAMVAAAADSDYTTAVNLPFRYTPGFRELVDRVDAGAIGEPRRVELTFRFPQWPREWQDVDWLETAAQGGPLREVGTHFLFGVQELFGPIDQVSARIRRVDPERYERSIVGYFEVDDIDGTVDVLTDHGEPETNVITVVGDDGSLSLRDWYRLVENPGHEDERLLVDERADTTTRLIDEFVAELNGDGGDLVSFEEANEVQRVVDAILESDGSPVAP